jgi:hypothetical protein
VPDRGALHLAVTDLAPQQPAQHVIARGHSGTCQVK